MSQTNDYIFHIIDQIKDAVVNRATRFLNGGSLEVTTTVRFINKKQCLGKWFKPGSVDMEKALLYLIR